MQWIKLGGRVTVILGGNNAGKSNVLRSIERLAPAAAEGHHFGRNGLTIDSHIDFNSDTSPRTITVALPFDKLAAKESVLSSRIIRVNEGYLERLLGAFASAVEQDEPHIVFEIQQGQSRFEVPSSFFDKVTSEAGLQSNHIGEISTALTSNSGGGTYEDISRITQKMREHLITIPEIVEIPALRFVRPSDGDTVPSGEGYVEAIKRLRSPGPGDQMSDLLYRQLCKGLGELLGLKDVEILVPEGSIEINIREGGLNSRHQFPLSSYGTGTEHAFIILLAALTNPHKLVCIEEPEIHLHPRLQRALVAVISEMAAGQVVLTSHSASFVDLPGASHIRVERSGRSTEVVSVSDQALFETVRALGARPSDLLQSNYVIWVEGPSDRVYVNHWISLIAPELREGVHYSIVFSAGSLIKHLTADEGRSDLIDLRRLNRSFTIIADRDRTTTDQALKEPIARLQSELSDDPDAVWITDGPTIESYLPTFEMLRAAKAVHPSVASIADGDGDVLTRLERRGGQILCSPLKTNIAIEATKYFRSEDELEPLLDKINVLVSRIRSAND